MKAPQQILETISKIDESEGLDLSQLEPDVIDFFEKVAEISRREKELVEIQNDMLDELNNQSAHPVEGVDRTTNAQIKDDHVKDAERAAKKIKDNGLKAFLD